MPAIYTTSKIDNAQYCRSNGQFTKHLRMNNLTYQQYYEKHVTGKSPKCNCGKALTFYQNKHTYANSCGNPTCVGKNISEAKDNQTDEVKRQQAANYSKAQRNKSIAQREVEKSKKAATYFSNYGTTVSNAPEQKDKSKATKLSRYGNEHYSGWEKSAAKNRSKTDSEQNIINEKRRETNMEKFGVVCPFLKTGVLEKSAWSNASGKEFTYPSGRIVGVRGYEDVVLSALLSMYTEEQIECHDMRSEYILPVFRYVNTNFHTAMYYPDIYIPHENKIIEVKAQFWWDGANTANPEKYKSRLENNLRKATAVVSAGYTYEVWLFADKKNYRILKHGTDF